MYSIAQLLQQLLANNPDANLAYLDPTTNPPTLHVHYSTPQPPTQPQIPKPLYTFPLQIHVTPKIVTLRAPADAPRPFNDHTACQNEPVELGTQIQPADGNWVGTAGAPVSWIDAAGTRRYGILSNWHVMAQGQRPAALQYQPSRSNPNPIATLTGHVAVRPDIENRVDAALADALIDGKHTIARTILGLGQPHPTPVNATVGLPVTKSGRTTAVTQARCSAIGAAVRVDYGDFEALFVDQDVFEATGAPFSAAGDSGSLILARQPLAPTSLLFAGGGNLTIGNPIRLLADLIDLTFSL